ncbi:MAG: M48 family metallopeptidase [Phycisphaerae bacterium]|nr:M48 family metallopeptidase [Phycisphaerae bacterium]
MKRTLQQNIVILACLLMVFLAGCTDVAITGRKQLNLVPDSIINSMALSEYNDFLKSPETKLSTDAEKTAMVERVGTRIAAAVERYMNENYMNDRIAGYKWEFNLVDSEEKNAWAMPGGKVVVYTGILEIAQDDAGLAVVMGHEIAHAIAKHGAERMSQALLVTAGGVALDTAMKDESSGKRTAFLTAYGVGTTVGLMLPYSRTHENEADRLGLIFMAMAGYNPETAVGFWERMAADKEGAQIPEFLSTHPAGETRIQNIKNNLYEAMPYYNKSLQESGQPAPAQNADNLGVYGL